MSLPASALADVLSFSARQELLEAIADRAIWPSPARLELHRLGLADAFGIVTPLGATVRHTLQRAPARDRAHKFAAKACYVTPGLELHVLGKGEKAPAGTERFPSLLEARRWLDLVQLERAKQIRNLLRQVSFPLYACRVDGSGTRVQVATYVADFVYRGAFPCAPLVVEDTKGVHTKEYSLKKRWFEAQEGLSIIEVHSRRTQRRQPKRRTAGIP